VFFLDRRDAGRQLAGRLEEFAGRGVVVLGLPRGGVPVAAEVARELRAPLDVCLVRKLGVPYQPELAMGAIGEGGVRVVNPDVLRATAVGPDDIAEVEAAERIELERRARRYRRGRHAVPLEGRTVLVVDDGVATGSTARAACRIARARGAARIVAAVPVAPQDWADRMGGDADALVCPYTPREFHAIGQFYADFTQTDDEEVAACLDEAAARSSATDREVELRAGTAVLRGRLTVPEGATGIVLFAHGSGSSRRSPRNRFVAAGLNRAGLGTFLFDLLTEEEAADRGNVFDTALLARRLARATAEVRAMRAADGLALGYFGASTGAAAALRAAAEADGRVAAVVSRGGRPDLAGPALAAVTAPTLLIVGGSDREVLALNRAARARLHCESDLAVVPGATHLFEEPGTLEQAADLARDWFTSHMAPSAASLRR
jgi:predicted phosphoribosyltransferase/dienelactone hydrolase